MNTDRLAQLEQQAAAISAEIAALKAGKAAAQPRPPRDEGVRIFAINEERSDLLPDLKEMRKLFTAVKDRAPWPLDTRHDSDKLFRGFCACFKWLANKGRTEFPNPKFALGFWLDNCKTWLRARNGVAGGIDATALVLAAYASGDIAYVPANGVLGHVWELALAEHVSQGIAGCMAPRARHRRDPAAERTGEAFCAALAGENCRGMVI
jgi:hypothetical protein